MSAMSACEPIALILPGKLATANAAAEDFINVLRSTRAGAQAKGVLLKEFGKYSAGEL
jgi:hypothetical protein